jgi:hypothetical protein
VRLTAKTERGRRIGLLTKQNCCFLSLTISSKVYQMDRRRPWAASLAAFTSVGVPCKAVTNFSARICGVVNSAGQTLAEAVVPWTPCRQPPKRPPAPSAGTTRPWRQIARRRPAGRLAPHVRPVSDFTKGRSRASAGTTSIAAALLSKRCHCAVHQVGPETYHTLW